MIALPLAAALSAAVLTTSFISGIFGMAGGMILMGILLMLLPVPAAMVLHGVTQIASNGWRAWLWRRHIRWSIAANYAAGAVAAALAFAWVAYTPSKAAALIILGLIPFAVLALPKEFAPDVTRPVFGAICGAVCTALQMLAGVSGPILDVFVVRADLDRHAMVATKAAIQVLGHCLKVAYFGHVLMAGGGAIAPLMIAISVVLALLGTQLSRSVLDAISDEQFRRWTRWLIVGVSTVYLMQGLYMVAIDFRVTAPAVSGLAGLRPL